MNIARAIGELKDAGVWTIGLDGDAPESYNRDRLHDAVGPRARGRGRGLRRLVRESCDRLASIPMRGHVASLNVSVAAAVVLFEAVRQRRPPAGGRRRGAGTTREGAGEARILPGLRRHPRSTL